MKKLLAGLIALSIVFALQAQQVSTSIDYSTGTAHISLPLGSYETGGYALPISLDYTASGVKVAQTASWVGLGWNLSAGGCITREVRNLPDDFKKENTSCHKEVGWLHWNDYDTSAFSGPYIQNFDFSESEEIQLENINIIRGGTECLGAWNWDSEPDIFSFSVGPISGSFIFAPGKPNDEAEDREILLLGDQNYKIDFTISSTTDELETFTITDDNGIQYVFSEKERMISNMGTIVGDSIIYSSSGGVQRFVNGKPINQVYSSEYSTWYYDPANHMTYKIDTEEEVTTSWHLERIIAPLKEEIQFYYHDEWIQLDESTFEKYREIYSGQTNNPFVEVLNNYKDDTFIPLIKTKKLDSISSKHFLIEFISETTRQDLNQTNISAGYQATALDSIKTYSKINNTLIQKKNYAFKYADFGTSSYDAERLILEEIQILNGSLNLPPYKFSYKGDFALPSRFSKAQDFWGYYNEVSSNSTLAPKIYFYENLTGSDRFRLWPSEETQYPYNSYSTFWGAERRPSESDDAVIGTLNEITYPTGGYIKLEYEPNRFIYDNGSSTEDDNEYYGAGIRIKKKTIGDGIDSNRNIVEEYVYEYYDNDECSGRLTDVPRYGYYDPTHFPPTCDSTCYNQNYVQTNTNLTKFTDGLIFYDEVQVKISGRGKQVITYEEVPTRFSNPNSFTHYDIPEVHYIREEDDQDYLNYPNTTGLYFDEFAYPFVLNSNYAWNRSLISMVSQYDTNDSLIKKVENFYSDHYCNSVGPQQVYGLLIDYIQNNTGASGGTALSSPLIVTSKYTINTGVGKQLDSSFTTVYDPNQSGKQMGAYTKYTYNEYGQLSEVESNNSDQTTSIAKYRYPTDFNYLSTMPSGSDDESRAICAMIDQNMLNTPIETIGLIDSSSTSTPNRYVISAALTLHKLQSVNSDSLPLAHESWVYYQDALCSEDNYSYCDFDSSGNLTKPLAYELISTVNEYDSCGNMLDANVENGNHSSVIWGYDNSLKVAEVANASYAEVGFTGFEYGESNGWTLSGSITTEKQTGTDCRKSIGGDYVAKSTGGYITRTYEQEDISTWDEEAGYTASAWIKGSSGGYIKMTLNPGGINIRDYTTIGDTSWQLVQVQCTKTHLDSCNPGDIDIIVEVKNNSSNTLLIDEVRFHPSDALMSTYSYKPGFGVISQSGPNNVFTYSQYDDLSRLLWVKNHDGHLISYKEYDINQNLSNGPNSIMTQQIFISGVQDTRRFEKLSNAQTAKTYEYLDGLARSIQTIQSGFSPNSKDFVSFAGYNKYGGQDTLWLPYASGENDGSYKTEARKDVSLFYLGSGSKTAFSKYPYSQIIYESSPQARVVEKSNPGSMWRLSLGHTKEYNYTFNAAGTVYRFRYDPDNHTASIPLSDKFYGANELIYTEVTDENDQVKGVYTDKSGKTIAIKGLALTVDNLWTYFVYDDFGRLVFKVSPKAVSNLSTSNYSFGWSSSLFIDYIFGYKYDEKGRLIIRKVPGKDPEYFVYDNLDRLILSQDGNLRDDDKWIVSRYDVLGRVVATAIDIIIPTKSQDAMQSVVDAHYADMTKLNYEYFAGVSTTYPHGYTNRTYPESIDEDDFLTIHYFDEYEFDADDDVDFASDTQLSLTSFTNRTKGLATGSKIKILESSPVEWLLSATYYDEYQRPVQNISQNHIGGYDRISNKLSFSGWLQQSKHTHNNGTSSIEELRIYGLDHRGRIKYMNYELGDSTDMIMYDNKYNELGQLVEKNLHGTKERGVYWQSIDYRYNIRGWLANINHSNLNNTNSRIDFDQYLNENEFVSGLVYDTITLSLTSVDSSNLTLTFNDSKYFLISTIDTIVTTESKLQYNENKEIQINKKIWKEFETYEKYTGDSFTFVFDSLHIYSNWEFSDITDSLLAMVEDQVTSQGVTDDTEVGHFRTGVNNFIAEIVATVYFNEDSDDLFGMDIYYDNGLTGLGGQPQYNGLISGIRWQSTVCDSLQGYGFEYDNAYRMTDANHGFLDRQGWDSENRYGVNNITYDQNGNITGLERRGLREYDSGTPVFGQIDDLTYTYIGNQLDRVDDAKTDGAAPTLNDFMDNGSEANNEYSYDDNGNLTADDNKQITSIKYNHLNLPTEIAFGSTKKIEYLYDATGRKLRKRVYYSSNYIQIDYVSSMIYTDGDLDYVLTEEGRMLAQANGNFRAEYFIKDHLGNTRVSFTDTDDDDDADVIQENHYYPYGMSFGDMNYVNGTKNEHLYQGKEEEDFESLYWYDFGARMFDEQLGRWHVPDPMNQYLSPYVGMGNRPSSMIDPDGMWSDAAYMSNLRGYDAYRLSKYRAFHNYNREIDALGSSMDELNVIRIQGNISKLMQDGYLNSIDNIIWGVSNYAGADAAKSINKTKAEDAAKIVMEYLKKHNTNGIPDDGILFAPSREAVAYQYMKIISNSLGVEVAAWLTESGVLVEPTEGKSWNGFKYSNTYNSSVSYINVVNRNGVVYAEFEKQNHAILARVHTHPSDGLPGYEDADTFKRFGVPNFVIGSSNVYINMGAHSKKNLNNGYVTSVSELFNGYSLLEYVKNLP